MIHLKSIFVAAAIVSAALIGSASAMPVANLGTTFQATSGIHSGVQDVRRVCSPFRCWWRPDWRWGPRPWWGWRRPFYWRRRWW